MANELTAFEDKKRQITLMESQFGMVLPPQINIDKFKRIAITAIQKVPALEKCTNKSLMGAFMDAAKDGLLPDGKEAAVIPFGENATYIPMVGGMLKKLRNSGELGSINVHVVNSNDEFNYFVDEKGEHFFHRPNFKNKGELIGAYMLAAMKDGAIYFEFMSKEEVDLIRARSRSKNNGPWVTDYNEMAKKTVLKRGLKRMPSSTDIEFTDNDFDTDAPVSAPATQAAKEAPIETTSRAVAEPEPAQPDASSAKQPSRLKAAMPSKPAEVVQAPPAGFTAKPPAPDEPPPIDFNAEDVPL